MIRIVRLSLPLTPLPKWGGAGGGAGGEFIYSLHAGKEYSIWLSRNTGYR